MKKAEKEILRPYFEEVWQSPSMVDYCIKDTDEFVKFENGYVFVFEKLSIETSFCFGYSLSRYDSKSYDDANDMVDYAKSNEEYFIKENLKQIELYEDCEYVALSKYGEGKIVYLVKKRSYDSAPSMYNGSPLFVLSKNDVKNVIEANQRQIENFKKRLNTYLKKFGLSKIKCWSYWRDA